MHGVRETSLLRRSDATTRSRAAHPTPARDARQLWLPTVGPPRRGADGLFLGVVPERALARAFRQVGVEARREGWFRGALVSPDLIHLTILWFTFDGIPPKAVRMLARAVRLLALHPFTLTIDELVINENGMLLRASDTSSVAALLRRYLHAALRQGGWGWGRGIGHAPHVTLSHDPGRPRRVGITPLYLPVAIVTVVRSLHGQGMHEHLERVVLTPPGLSLRTAASLAATARNLPTAGACGVTA